MLTLLYARAVISFLGNRIDSMVFKKLNKFEFSLLRDLAS